MLVIIIGSGSEKNLLSLRNGASHQRNDGWKPRLMSVETVNEPFNPNTPLPWRIGIVFLEHRPLNFMSACRPTSTIAEVWSGGDTDHLPVFREAGEDRTRPAGQFGRKRWLPGLGRRLSIPQPILSG
jgi:hypothetical protein